MLKIHHGYHYHARLLISSASTAPQHHYRLPDYPSMSYRPHHQLQLLPHSPYSTQHVFITRLAFHTCTSNISQSCPKYELSPLPASCCNQLIHSIDPPLVGTSRPMKGVSHSPESPRLGPRSITSRAHYPPPAPSPQVTENILQCSHQSSGKQK